MVEFAGKKLQRKKGGRHSARHRDYIAAQRVAKIDMLIWIWDLGIGLWDFSDKNRPIPIAHARAAGQQRIAFTHVCIRVD